MKILLDPGHGLGENRGSVIGHEGDHTFQFAVLFKEELEKFGFRVGMTRKSIQDNPTLKRRGQMAQGYDLFLSLHTNAGPKSAKGCEIFGDLNAYDSHLMEKMLKIISQTIPTKNRGIKWRRRSDGKVFTQKSSPGGSNWYGVLYYNQAPVGMLIEFCFHTNEGDLNSFLINQRRLAKNLAKMMAEYYNLITPKTVKSGTTNWSGVLSLYSEEYFQQAKKLSIEHNYLILSYDFYNGTGRSWKEWKDSGLKIVAIGGVPGNHTRYLDEFIE